MHHPGRQGRAVQVHHLRGGLTGGAASQPAPGDATGFGNEAGGFRATELCRGPWDPDSLHGGPVAALVGHVADAFDDDGWFRTGDLGHLRPDGHVVLTGRLKDVIIRKGENISAKEIEDVLYPHPKVGDVAVIGLPDRERGERVCAVVERAEGQDDLTFDEMAEALTAAQLMRQKFPEQLEVVDQLPRNETLHKVLKFKLREEYAAKPWP